MKILAFGIHPDDVELGCGGSVILGVRLGHEVVVADLSEGASSSNGTPEERAAEAAEAARIMGVAKRINLRLPDARIQSESDEQLAAVLGCIRSEKPDLVFVPNSDDPHPDHESGGRLIERALYLAGVPGYRRGEEAWRVAHSLVYAGREEFEPQVIFDVSSTHETKILSILAHRSQFVSESGRKATPLNSPDFISMIESRGRVWGHRVGVRFGEPFKSRRPLALEDFRLFAR
jgi:bacillithiol biosynthesis deacetylase BshB1